MRVSELIDMLRDQPPDAEVELAVIAPVDDDSEDITVDRYSVEGMLPWSDDDDELVIWLVGGEDADVEAFLDAIESDHDPDDHDGHAERGVESERGRARHQQCVYAVQQPVKPGESVVGGGECGSKHGGDVQQPGRVEHEDECELPDLFSG